MVLDQELLGGVDERLGGLVVDRRQVGERDLQRALRAPGVGLAGAGMDGERGQLLASGEDLDAVGAVAVGRRVVAGQDQLAADDLGEGGFSAR